MTVLIFGTDAIPRGEKIDYIATTAVPKSLPGGTPSVKLRTLSYLRRIKIGIEADLFSPFGPTGAMNIA